MTTTYGHACQKRDAAAEAVERARALVERIALAVAAEDPERAANLGTAAGLSQVLAAGSKLTIDGDMAQPQLALRALTTAAHALRLLIDEFTAADAALRVSAQPFHDSKGALQ